MTLSRSSTAALAPVRELLRAAAQKESEDIRREADARATAELDAARLEASRIEEAALAEGEASARAEAALRSARVRRQAKETVLTQRNALRLELHRRVAQSARELRSDPAYPELLASLTERSRSLLGPHVIVTEAPDGGVLAESGSRRVDLSLPMLAAGTLESMASEVSALWTP